MIQLPFRVIPYKTCKRCKKVHRQSLDECPHCSHITSEHELQQFKQHNKQKLQANVTLGLFFLVIAALIIMALAMALL